MYVLVLIRFAEWTSCFIIDEHITWFDIIMPTFYFKFSFCNQLLDLRVTFQIIELSNHIQLLHQSSLGFCIFMMVTMFNFHFYTFQWLQVLLCIRELVQFLLSFKCRSTPSTIWMSADNNFSYFKDFYRKFNSRYRCKVIMADFICRDRIRNIANRKYFSWIAAY